MIYILAGHHNADPGAIGVNNIREADLTKVIRDLVIKRMKEINPKCFVTKDDDRDALSQVIAKIKPKLSKKDLIIDIHFNAAVSTATGFEVVVSDNASDKSLEVANDLCKVLPAVFNVKNRGVKREKDTPRKRLAILNLICPAVIIELAFITNSNDLEKLEKNLHWLCEDIALIALKHGK